MAHLKALNALFKIGIGRGGYFRALRLQSPKTRRFLKFSIFFSILTKKSGEEKKSQLFFQKTKFSKLQLRMGPNRVQTVSIILLRKKKYKHWTFWPSWFYFSGVHFCVISDLGPKRAKMGLPDGRLAPHGAP